MEPSRHCQSLTQRYLDHQANFPFQKMYRDLLEKVIPMETDNVNQLLIFEKEARNSLIKEFEVKARELMKKWTKENSPTQADKLISCMSFDENGRITMDGSIFENNLISIHLGYDYFPSLVRKVEGNLTLGHTKHVPGLEEVTGDLITGWVVFEGQNLRKVGGKVKTIGRILKLPQLQEIGGSLYGDELTDLDLSSLTSVNDLHLFAIKTLDLPQVVKIRGLNLQFADKIKLPKAENIGNLNAPELTQFYVPNLKESGEITADKLTELVMPSITKSGTITLHRCQTLVAPLLNEINGNLDLSISQIKGKFNYDLGQLRKINNTLILNFYRSIIY